jgi:outer membrane protein TolC
MTALVLVAVVLAADVPAADAAETRVPTPARLAAGSGPLSLGEVLTAADEVFPLVVGARADVDAADGERLAAAGAFDPVWRTRATTVPVSGYPQTRLDTVIDAPTPWWGTSFFAGYRLGVGKYQDYYGFRETWTGGELRAGAMVPLVRNGPIDRRRATLARAELGQALSGQSLQQQRLEVARLAAFRYWDWVAAGQRREVARSLLALAKTRDEQLAARASAGDVARFDRQDNQRALVQREALLVQTQRGLDQAAFELSLFLRDAAGEPVMPDESRLPTRVPEPDPHAGEGVNVDEALARRPDVQRLENQKKQLEVELSFQKNQLLPALDVGVAVSKDLGASPRPEADGLGPVELEVNALLEVPLLYRAPLGRLQATRAAATKVDAQLRLAKDRVSVDVRDALSALKASRERAAWTRQEVEVAAQLEQGERTRFTLGDSNQFLVNLREQATAEARLREVDAMADFQKAVAALKAATAAPMP